MMNEDTKETTRQQLDARFEKILSALKAACSADNLERSGLFTTNGIPTEEEYGGDSETFVRERALKDLRAVPIAGDLHTQIPLWSNTSQEIEGTPPILPPDILKGFRVLENETERIVSSMVDEIELLSDALIGKRYREAVLARPEITAHWPWPCHLVYSDGVPPPYESGGVLIELMQRATKIRVEKAYYWPGAAAPGDVAHWAEKRLNKLGKDGKADKLGSILVDLTRQGRFLIDGYLSRKPSAEQPTWIRVSATGLALLYVAQLEVTENQRRPFIAIDSSPHHDSLIGSWRASQAGEIEGPTITKDNIARISLIGSERDVQLQLPIPNAGPQSFSQQLINALCEVKGQRGLRHWVTLLALFAPGRRGYTRWMLDEHLIAMGVSEDWRRKRSFREKVAREVEALTHLELSVEFKNDQGDTYVVNRPLLLRDAKLYEKIEGESYLEGIQLQPNEWVYGGVRKENGQIGKLWYPAPIELAQVNERKWPSVIPLGLHLAIRFRWDTFHKTQKFTRLSGKRLLTYASIEVKPGEPGRAWGRLEKTLNKLVEIGLIGEYVWSGKPWTNATMYDIYPAQRLVDVAERKLLPEEVIDIPPATGGELKVWRKSRGLSQKAAADKLKVGIATIKRAETSGGKLKGRLLTALKEEDHQSVTSPP